jgi:hypothetical protein
MKKYFIIATITIIILALVGVAVFLSRKEASFAPVPEEEMEIQETKEAIQEDVKAQRYENKKYGFSFEKPEGYTVGAIRDDLGEILLVQNTDAKSGFQIYITPTDGATTLSPEQIKIDLPGTSIGAYKIIKLDGKGDGLMFESNNSAFAGASYEIWFTYKGYLYQISSYKNFKDDLQKIINSWKFEN